MASMKRSYVANDSLIDRTILLWGTRREHGVSQEDAREIAHNITNFFEILSEWSGADVVVPENGVGISANARTTAEPPHDG
jgi:hypothetical protein